jgi:cytochrome P450
MASSIIATTLIRLGLLTKTRASSSSNSTFHGPSAFRTASVAALSTAARSFSSTSIENEGVPAASPDNATTKHPKLKEIPSLPFVGSMISAYSGYHVDLKGTSFVKDIRERNQEYGPFYSVGIPGFGQGLYCTVHVLSDPDIMAKILRQEAQYPAGIVEGEWPLIEWMEKKGYHTGGFLKRGPEWKRMRTYLQKDLLAPASAKSYLPAIVKGARMSSSQAVEFTKTNDMMPFLNMAAFDMFNSVLFGGERGMSDDTYEKFCSNAVGALSDAFNIMRNPFAKLLFDKVGYESVQLKKFQRQMDVVDDIARKRATEFLERAEKRELSEDEKNSYFYKLIERQSDSENDITKEEMIESVILVMMAGVDTTASKISWNILQLAINPEIQEKLYHQIKNTMDEEDGDLAAIIEKQKVPLLSAFVRETHRCTPPLASDIVKDVSTPTEVHGIVLPAGSKFMFDALTVQMDPEIVDDPLEFRPERWFKEAVEMRKNTHRAILDHPFYSGPFSQGSRRCPASRVAYLEVQTVLASLLLHCKITGPTDVHWSEVKGKLQTMFVPDFALLPEIRFEPR